MKNKDFIKTKTIKVPLYPFFVTFCLVRPEVASKYLKGDGYTTIEEDTYDIFIYLDKEHSLSTAVHELFHATEIIMDRIGEKITPGINESWAYLIGWFAEEYEKFMKS